MDESSSSNNIEDMQTQNYLEFDENGEGACSDFVVPTPTVGMVFPSFEEIEAYYIRYGQQEGFGVVRAAVAFKHKGGMKTTERRSCLWKCECYGKPDCRKKVNGKRVTIRGVRVDKTTRNTKKCECPALMYATLNKEQKWEVKRVVDEHQNHSPTPDRKILKSAVKRKLFNDRAPSIEMPQSSLAYDSDGVEDMETARRDMRSVIDQDKRLKFREGDADALMDFIKKMSTHGQDFFRSYRFDDFGSLKDVIWVDARSRVAYEEFGDVVWFDSTCLMNDYELPLVNFVGINHHGQSVLFGCALLSHADTDTFQWLFSTWLRCMCDKPPGGILTDQDASVREALEIVMPTTRHRWNLRYILEKFSNKFRRNERYLELKELLHNAIYHSLTPEEFESSWNFAIKEFSLESNDWLIELYEDREMWVPAYMKNVFWAGMKATERDQGVKSFFDGYLGKHTRLSEFAPQYCNAMESNVDDEEEADARTGLYRRHIIRVYDMYIIELPEKYILRRWRKDISRRHTLVKVPYYDPSKTERGKRYEMLMATFQRICLEASASEEKTAIALAAIRLMEIEFDEKIAIGGGYLLVSSIDRLLVFVQ